MDYLAIGIVGESIPIEDLILLRLLTVFTGSRIVSFSTNYTSGEYNDIMK